MNMPDDLLSDSDALFARARRRLAEPAWRPYSEALRVRAAHFRNVPATPIDRTRHNWILEEARWLQRRVLTVALWARLSGEKAAAEDTLRLLHGAARWELWSCYGGPGQRFDLGTGEMAALFGWTVAWLGPMLDDGERQRLAALAGERLFAPYLEACPEQGQRAWWHAGALNWNAVCNGGVMVAALLLPEAPGATACQRLAAIGLESYLAKGINPDGSSSESIGYWSYGITYLLHAALAHIHTTGGPHPAFALPVLGPAMDFPFAFSTSDGAGLGFGDSNYFLPPPLLFAACARNGRGDISDEMHRRLIPGCSVPPESLDPILDHLAVEACALLYGEDPGERKLPAPALTSWPTVGWHLLRADHLRLGLRGGNNDAPHTMRDLAAITLADDRQVLLASIEHWPYVRGWFLPEARPQFWEDSTGSKCALLVNGVGQARRCASEAGVLPDGAWVDATAAYPKMVTKARRTVRLLADGFLVEDEVASDQPAFPESRFVSDGTFVRINERTWMVERGGSRAYLTFSTDAAWAATPCLWPHADPNRPPVATLRVHATTPLPGWRLTTRISRTRPANMA